MPIDTDTKATEEGLGHSSACRLRLARGRQTPEGLFALVLAVLLSALWFYLSLCLSGCHPLGSLESVAG